MSRLLVDEIAQEIRHADGNGDARAYEVAERVNELLYRKGVIDIDLVAHITVFAWQARKDGKVGAGRLAEMIMDQFQLKEQP